MLKQLLKSVPAENVYVGRWMKKEKYVHISYVPDKRLSSYWTVHCSYKNFKKVFKEVYDFEFSIRWDKLFYCGGKNFKDEID